MIQAVVIAGDLLRPEVSGDPGGADRQTLWLWNALKRQIHLACGLPVERLTTADLPALRQEIEAQRAPADADAWWAARYQRSSPPPNLGSPRDPSPQVEGETYLHLPLEPLIAERLRGRFCVGYELPPWLIRMLETSSRPLR